MCVTGPQSKHARMTEKTEIVVAAEAETARDRVHDRVTVTVTETETEEGVEIADEIAGEISDRVAEEAMGPVAGAVTEAEAARVEALHHRPITLAIVRC